MKDLTRPFTKEEIQVTHVYMKRGSSYVMKELQVKTKVRYHYSPIRMAKIHNTNNTECRQGWGAIGTLTHCLQECKMVPPIWKTVWQFLTKLNIVLSYSPAIVLISIYPNEVKTYVYTKTCKQMFIAALFTIANTWKQ